MTGARRATQHPTPGCLRPAYPHSDLQTGKCTCREFPRSALGWWPRPVLHHHHAEPGHLKTILAPHSSFANKATETRDGVSRAKVPNRLVPTQPSGGPASPSRARPQQVWATVGVRNSQSLVLSGPLSPACAQVPGSCLSSGDLSSSAWALIRRRAEQKQSFCPHMHFCSAAWAE